MGDVRIERFRARYHDTTPERSELFDRALGALVAGSLDDALADAQGSSPVWAICIPAVTVEVSLGTGGLAACTAAWAEAIAGAVRAAAAGDDPRQDQVVVFPTRADALVDLVRSVALGDQRHAWAWRQVGLVAGPAAGRADVVDALRGEPLLVPGVLCVVGPDLLDRVIEPRELALLAGLVAAAVGRRSAAIGTSERAPAMAAGVVPAVRCLPGRVSAWLRKDSAAGNTGSAETAHDVAVLATMVAQPLRSQDDAFISQVAATLIGANPAAARPEVSSRGHEGEHEDGPEHGGRHRADPDSVEVAQPDVEGADGVEESLRDDSPPDELRTEWGGVWFLAHALGDTDVVASAADLHTPARALGQLVSHVTGAPVDDVSIRLLCSGAEDEEAGFDDEVAVWLPGAIASVEAWLADRADGALAALHPALIWRRTAVVRESPGQVEVEFALADVDTTLRSAGLDLDPGWVWWLGCFVRFRYV